MSHDIKISCWQAWVWIPHFKMSWMACFASLWTIESLRGTVLLTYFQIRNSKLKGLLNSIDTFASQSLYYLSQVEGLSLVSEALHHMRRTGAWCSVSQGDASPESSIPLSNLSSSPSSFLWPFINFQSNLVWNVQLLLSNWGLKFFYCLFSKSIRSDFFMSSHFVIGLSTTSTILIVSIFHWLKL